MVRAAGVRYGSGACKAESRVLSEWKTVLFERNRILSGRISNILAIYVLGATPADFIPRYPHIR